MQHSITTLLQHRFEWLQHCSNIATNRSAALEIVVSNRLVLRSATTRRQRKRQKKKTVGLISKTPISNMHHVFHISLPLLHYCDMKMPHFTFNGERKEAMTKLYFSLWTWIWSLGIRLQEGSSGFDKVSRRVVFKTDRTLIHFSSEVLVAVTSLDLEVPSIITHELELYCHLVSCWVHVLSIHSRFSSFLLVTRKY